MKEPEGTGEELLHLQAVCDHYRAWMEVAEVEVERYRQSLERITWIADGRYESDYRLERCLAIARQALAPSPPPTE